MIRSEMVHWQQRRGALLDKLTQLVKENPPIMRFAPNAIALMLASLVTLAMVQPALGFDHGEEATPPATPGAATPGAAMSGTGAVYLVVQNLGDEADRLVAGTTPVAQAVEFHNIVQAEGVMQMRPLPDGVDVPAGNQVAFAPGGYHIMLIGLTEDLRNGMTFELMLEFERAGSVAVPVQVQPRAAPEDGEAITSGDIVVEAAWARPAPALGAPSIPAATPTA